MTGHSGFKGGWTALWLSQLGAKVYGYSLAPKSEPNFFELTKLKNILTNNTFTDILDLNKLTKAIND